MDQFIKQVTTKLGIGETAARSATGSLMQAIADRVPAGDFAQLKAQLPGAAEMMRATPSAEAPAAGVFGGLMNAVGGQLGSVAGLGAQLQKAGLNLDQAGPFVSQFIDFAKTHAGADVVSRILTKFPEIKKFLG